MFPNDFDYAAPTSLEEAIAILQQNPDAKVLAGGHSLLPLMKLRLSSPSMLVDIGKIDELKGIHMDGSVSIGAYTTYRELEESQELATRLPIIRECMHELGDPQVRNRGTIGGSLAHADPAADLPAVVVALGAQINVAGPNGERTVAADDFFVDLLQSALEDGEILTAITLPQIDGRAGMAYEKFENPASGYAICGVAAVVRKNDDGSLADCRITVTGAGPKVQRARAAEDALEGGADVAAAAEKASDGLDFIGDLHASEEYRAHLTRVLTKRALAKAMERAG